MNTRKTIGISMIALLVVALSVSMAAADGWDASSLEVNLQDDGVATNAFTLKWTPGDMPATWVVLNGATGTTSDNIRMSVAGENAYANTGSGMYNSTGITYDVKDVTANVGDIYMIEFTNDDGSTWNQIVTVKIAVIPEFATIAIPVVALLGLVLFMRRKKD